MVNCILLTYPYLNRLRHITFYIAWRVLLAGIGIVAVALGTEEPFRNQAAWIVWELAVYGSLSRLLLHYRRQSASWRVIIFFLIGSFVSYWILMGLIASDALVKWLGVTFEIYFAFGLTATSALFWRTIYHNLSLLYFGIYGVVIHWLSWIRLDDVGGILNLLSLGDEHSSIIDPLVIQLTYVLFCGIIGFIWHWMRFGWLEYRQAPL